MNEQEQEILRILQEECAEVIQAISKVFRFGMYASHPDTPTITNQLSLHQEIGDVLAMIDLLEKTGVVDAHKLIQCKKNKFLKLREWSNIEQ
jgi:NTP pyrophosphatase (non-canonical NTP hydrolase)